MNYKIADKEMRLFEQDRMDFFRYRFNPDR